VIRQDIDLLSIAKAIGTPAIAFVFGGLLSSQVQWGLEKKKQVLARRRELVTDWRMNLVPMLGQPAGQQFVWAGERQRAFMSSPYYASLRPHLTEAAIKEIENPTIKLFIQQNGSTPRTNDWNYHYPLKIVVDEDACGEREEH
jgi:hypothetical protein